MRMWTARVTIVKIFTHNSAAIVSQCTGILAGDREELSDMKVFTFQYFSFWGLEIKAFTQYTVPILHIDSLSTEKFLLLSLHTDLKYIYFLILKVRRKIILYIPSISTWVLWSPTRRRSRLWRAAGWTGGATSQTTWSTVTCRTRPWTCWRRLWFVF